MVFLHKVCSLVLCHQILQQLLPIMQRRKRLLRINKMGIKGRKRASLISSSRRAVSASWNFQSIALRSFADHDEANNRLLFGVEHSGIVPDIDGELLEVL